MSKPSICFISNELYPLGPGGIGRMMYNFARQNADDGFPAELHFLVPPDLANSADARARLHHAYDGLAEVHVASPLHEVPDHTAHLMDRASLVPWSLDLMWSTSYRYFRELQAIEARRGKPFDIIEFPDFGGWALASVEAKRAGLAFENTTLAARLHSTQGVISRAERFFDPSHWNGILMDAEAHLLRHADVIIGHEQFVVDHNKAHYNLAKEWDGKTVLEFPAVLLDDVEKTVTTDLGTAAGPDTDFIFSSRLQRFKRPDIFVRAAIAFAERHPEHRGVFRLVSYGWDAPYIDWMMGLVPDHMHDKIQFITQADAQERAAWLAQSVVVVPSDYESLCLFAYESSVMGASVILNRTCGVFGQGSRWHETDNCLMFDGSVDGLVTSMEEALTWIPKSRVDLTPDQPYWESHTSKITAQTVKPTQVKVVGFGYKTTGEIERHIESLTLLDATLDHGFASICLMLPQALCPKDSPLALAAAARGWDVVLTSGLEECPEMLRKRLCEIEAEAIILCPPDYALRAEFVHRSSAALTRNAACDIVGGHLEEIDRDTGAAATLRCFSGEMPSHALLSSRIAPVCSAIRKTVFETRAFDPRACAQWFEVFIRDCALDQISMLIVPDVIASIEGAAAAKLETSRKLSSGIVDQVGLKARLPSRLLAIEPRLPGAETATRNIALPSRALFAAEPVATDTPTDAISYNESHQGLMVQPRDARVPTLAQLTGPAGRIASLTVQVFNAQAQNDGAEVAIAVVPKSASAHDIEALLELRGRLPRGYACGNWTWVAPHETCTLSLNTRGASTGKDRIILISRLISGASKDNAQIIFRGIETCPEANLF